MPNLNKEKHITDVIFVFALFCVFAVSAVTIMLLGSNVYKNIASNMNKNFDTRTSLQYVAAKIHQNDTRDSIYLSDVEGIPAIYIEQDIEGIMYLNIVYYDEGYIQEIFTEKDNDFDKTYARPVIEADDFEIETLSDRLFKLSSINEEGVLNELYVSTRT